VVGGARKLANAEGYDGVYVSADEPAEVRRKRVIERLKSRAVRAGQEAIVSLDGVLSLNGIEVYSVSRGRICDFSITNGSD
jgi:orotidine-5'-phosphate decarboxylase